MAAGNLPSTLVHTLLTTYILPWVPDPFERVWYPGYLNLNSISGADICIKFMFL